MTSYPRLLLATHCVRTGFVHRLPLFFILIGITLATSANADKPDCQCRAPDGAMKNLGTVQCVDIVGTKRLVRCEMSQNNPCWKSLEGGEGCPAPDIS